MHDQTTAAALTAIAQGDAAPYAMLPAGVMIAPHTRKPNRRPGAVPTVARKIGRVIVALATRAGRYVAALWNALPGPWPVKVLLVGAAVIEPGPFGEIALAAYANAVAARRARKAGAK